MEMYLEGKGQRFVFPYVPPLTISKGYDIKTFDSVNGKEFTSYAGSKLEEISFTIQFPTSERSYASTPMNGWEIIERLQTLITEQETLHFAVTETNLNYDVFVQNLNYSVPDPSLDLSVDFSLKRVLEPQVVPWSPQTQPVNKNKIQIGGLGFKDKLGEKGHYDKK